MRKSKIEHAAEARRGVRVIVRCGDMTITLVSFVDSSWASVQPAQPVPMMTVVGLWSEVAFVRDEEEEEEGDVVWERVVTMLYDKRLF